MNMPVKIAEQPLRLQPSQTVSFCGNPHGVIDHFAFRPDSDAPVVHRLKVLRLSKAETKWILLIERPGEPLLIKRARQHTAVTPIAEPFPAVIQIARITYGPLITSECDVYRTGEAEPFARGVDEDLLEAEYKSDKDLEKEKGKEQRAG